MAIEIVGKGKDVERYRKYLHEQGILTKQFLNHLRSSGQQISPKPEGFRVFNTPIKKVFGESKKGIFEDDQKLFIAGIANANIVDRMDERLEPAGVDVRNYLKNRVLLLDHLYVTSAVIGRVYELKTEENGVHFEAYIGDPKAAPLTQQQKDARSLVAQKLVQTVSVGFMPLKIQAPVFDEEGKLMEPAVIVAWELLELSVVAVPANPGAVFDLKEVNSFNTIDDKPTSYLTNSKNTQKIKSSKSKQEDSDGTVVQTLIFLKEYFEKEEALEWAKGHDYKADKVDENDDSYRIRQHPPEDFEESSLKTLEIDKGIKAVVGKLKSELQEEEKMEKMLEELLEAVKGLATQLGAVSDSIKSITDNNTTILSKLDAIEIIDERGMDEEEEEEKEKGSEEDEDKEMEEDEEEDEDEVEEKLLQLAEVMQKQGEKIDIISQTLLRVIENSNG